MENGPNPSRAELTSDSSAAFNDRIVRTIKAAVRRRKRAARTEATEENLVEVWDRWHQLPTNLLPEEKRTVLTCERPPKLLLEDPAIVSAKARIGTLDPSFSKTIDRAVLWEQLREFHASTIKLYTDRIQLEWAWEWPVNPAVGRLAIFRAIRELDVSDPGLTSKRRPTLTEISLLEKRFHAYRVAREHGLRTLRTRLDQLIPKGKPVDYARRAPAMWTDRTDVLREYLLAAMRSLNLIPDRILKEEDCRLAVHRNQNETRRFRAILNSNRPLRKNSIVLFQLWLIDNRPLIERFQLSKAALIARAHARRIPIFGHDSDTSKWDLGFKFKRGQAPSRWDHIHRRLLELLSPRPLFAGIT